MSTADRKRKRDDEASADISKAKVEKTEDNVVEEDEGGGEDALADDVPTAEYLSRNCPYLDTINRNILDFDFEKLCSVNMSNNNVYACLVCGKFYQGRGLRTHAHIHSLETGHHVYLNLGTLKFYCLPDNYEIIDNSLEDIRYYCKPVFTKKMVQTIDDTAEESRALDGQKYLPGVVGLNNIKANDYVNVVVQILCRALPFRNYFLDENNYIGITKDPLVVTFGELVRKIWNARNFKSHVSPHEFLQAVVNASKKAFKITEQSDPFSFISWLLNALHSKLKVKKKSIVHKVFQGKLKVITRKLPPSDRDIDDLDSEEYEEKVTQSQFLVLPLDVPPPPLFADDVEQNIIPQVPLFELLNKYDGVTEKEYQTHKDLFVKKFEITELPEYLLVHISRFTKNTFFTEKNPTIVNFPVKNLIMKDYVSTADGSSLYKYDLVANVVHEGLAGAGKGTYNAQVLHKGSEKYKKSPWFDTQDLHVDSILPQMITLSTSYIQIWERQPDTLEEIKAMEEAAKAQAVLEAAPQEAGPVPMDQGK